MANTKKISLLSKYQMKVLYYKSREGATHEEIAEILGRDVNTVQYHMTKIYKILDIAVPGKSKEEMDSELKNEVCPIIRQMFQSIDDVKTWAPSIKKLTDEEKVVPAPQYQSPPSLEKVLRQAGNQSSSPEILESPPPGRTRVNWGVVILMIIGGCAIFAGWRIVSNRNASPTQPIAAFTQTAFAQYLLLPTIPAFPTRTPTIAPTFTSIPSATYTPIPTATPTIIPTPTAIVTQISSIDGMVLVFVPAGEFKMGSAKADDPQAMDEEIPQHIVYLDAYWIDQTEVTNAQYAACVASGTCTKPSDSTSLSRSSYYDNQQYANYPAIFVTWIQAAAYCNWVGRRLPTEAMWEKAARGPDGLIFPWGNTFDGTRANYCDINCINGWKDSGFDDGYLDTSPVGDYPAGVSIYGALDMSGNVYEWVADWFEPYRRINQLNPTGPTTGTEHIIRGGSWGDDSARIRAAVRSHMNVPGSSNFIGFRCAR
jgi:formylglycine-generating enzyme required for sulfatase activity